MTDANYSSRTSPPPRTSSLADLVHNHDHSHPPPQQPPLLPPPLLPPRLDSDDGSQQERNHQRPPHRLHNLPRLPPPGDVSRTARHVANVETSPKHPYRKRKHSQPTPGAIPPDLSSLTQKLDDHASSIARLPPSKGQQPLLASPPHREERQLDKFRPRPEGAEGSTDINPIPSSGLANPEYHSPGKQRIRGSPKEPSPRTELLEENRHLRIELESLKYRLRQADKSAHKQKKEMREKDTLLAKYRTQLVDLFEAGDGDLFHVNKAKYMADSPGNGRHGVKLHDTNSKIDGESISNSQEEDWSSYSAPSLSVGYEHEKFEDRRRNDKDPYGRSEATIRKHRRTRAPAWTPDEENVFIQAYNKHGCQWKLFQDSLPGRSRRQIQSHGSYLIRQGKLLKKNSRPWQRRKPRPGAPSSSVKDAEVEGEEINRSDGEEVTRN